MKLSDVITVGHVTIAPAPLEDRRVLGATPLLFQSRVHNWDSHSKPAGASLQKTGRANSASNQYLRNPARPAERECSAGCFRRSDVRQTVN